MVRFLAGLAVCDGKLSVWDLMSDAFESVAEKISVQHSAFDQ
ncbi:hypothetical protein [Symmachiella dynata]|tara:strand:+ start:401 stop:526 length:126 start_codon:yes stop_codon:yes gene_type:complete